MNGQQNWSLSITQIQEHSPEEIVALLENSKADGFISAEMEIPEVADFFERSTIPLVVIGTRRRCIPERLDNLAFTTFNEDAIGVAGAKYLMSLGNFASYSFIHYTEKPYSHLSFLRKRSFRKTLLRNKLDCTTYGEPGEAIATDNAGLEKYLASLPKPAAIMVGCDKRAVEVIDAARRIGIAIPGDISLISVDNDEILCNSVRPNITSIAVNNEAIGVKAVNELKRLLKRATFTPRSTIIDARIRVVERESSSVLSPGLHLVKRALKYINENAEHGLTVTDVVNYLGVSRRLADLRFQNFGSKSILEAITEARLKVVKHRLRTTRLTIMKIAEDCGFKNENYLKILFKRHTGQTMREYRLSARSDG